MEKTKKLIPKKFDDFNRHQEYAINQMVDLLGWENPDIDALNRWENLINVLLREDFLDEYRTLTTFKECTRLAVTIRQSLVEIRSSTYKKQAFEAAEGLAEQIITGALADLESVQFMIMACEQLDLAKCDFEGDEFRKLVRELNLIKKYQTDAFDEE